MELQDGERTGLAGDYQSFAHFAEFMQKEAQIACNLIASPLLINFKAAEERVPKKAKSFKINVQTRKSTITAENMRPKPPCLVCINETYGVVKWPAFNEKMMEEKKTFIHENHLCFGCL